MKKRTRVFAWIFAIGASLGAVRYCLILASLVIEPPAMPSSGNVLKVTLVALAVNVLFLIGWTNLLDRRIWAWRLLVAMSGVLGVVFGLGGVVAGFLLEDHVAAYIAVLIVPSILPLWILLTDRPSGWSQAATPQSEIPNPQ